VQLGHGRYQQRIQATVTGRTSHIAVELASDKEETNKILASLGLPVPRQELVQSEGQAVRSARRIGYPVVTKPTRQPRPRHLHPPHHGGGGRAGLCRGARALAFGDRRDLPRGDDHRLLVVNGELVAATRRTPGHVVGDGRRKVVELVELVNQDPRRGVGHEKVLTRLEIDAQALKMLGRAGLTPESVPEAGQVVYLRSTANSPPGAPPPT